MPMPKPGSGESEKDFISRCMSALSSEFNDDKQRSAVCYRQWRGDSKDMAYDLMDVEIFRPGNWNGKEYTDKDINDLVDSYARMGYVPPVKLGHAEESGAQAWGWVKNLRNVAGKLVGDLTDLPEKLYNAIKEKRYNALSAEIFFNLKRDKEVFRRALKAVALLGAEVPALSNLKPLEASLSEADYEAINYFDIEVLEMEELQKLKEENAKLAKQLTELQGRKDLTEDVAKLTQKIADKEAAISGAAARIATLETQLKQAKISDKVAKLAVPAYRDYFAALYNASELTQTVKFGEGEKSIEQILDGLVEKLNHDAETLFKEIGTSGGNDKIGERADVQLSRKTKEYMESHKDVGYSDAFHKVLENNPELAQAYIQS